MSPQSTIATSTNATSTNATSTVNPSTSVLIAQLERSIAAVVRGKDEAIRFALIALLGRGHLLIEDVPGVGKTTLAQALAHSFHCTFHRVQFTSDMLPSDVIGISIYNQIDQRFEFKPGPIFANIVLADEINRTTPKTQSALLEAMNEAQVTIDNYTYPLPQPFMVLATQIPVEHHGTYPLPESQLDRFMLRIRMGYPSHESEKDILRSHAGPHAGASVTPVLEAGDVAAMQQAVERVRVDDSLLDYALEIVARTRQTERLVLGVSPRGSLMLQRAAQARAFVEGRDFCVPDDFKQLIIPVFAHRLVVNTRYATTEKKSAQAEAILTEIIESARVPL
jgi:MoxR-like ATPase